MTPFCENGDVDHYMGSANLSLRQSVDSIVQVLSGLSYLHSNNFVHRDLKPSNIFVDSNRNFLIGDFGSVKKMTDGWSSNLSSHSHLYQPPETFSVPRFHKTGDIYQVGIVMYQLLGGRLSYEERDYFNAKEAEIYDSMPDPIEQQLYFKKVLHNCITKSKIIEFESIPPWIPTSLRKIIAKATKPKYIDRYQSAAEMSAALTNCRTKLRPWEVRDGFPTLAEATEFRIVPVRGSCAIEKRRTGQWRSISVARDITLADAVKFAENGG